jgi:hypothetical protein
MLPCLHASGRAVIVGVVVNVGAAAAAAALGSLHELKRCIG